MSHICFVLQQLVAMTDKGAVKRDRKRKRNPSEGDDPYTEAKAFTSTLTTETTPTSSARATETATPGTLQQQKVRCIVMRIYAICAVLRMRITVYCAFIGS